MTFGEAFAAARAAGLPDFEYNGKRYTTQLAGESKKRKPESKVKKEIEALIPNLPKTEELEPTVVTISSVPAVTIDTTLPLKMFVSYPDAILI